MRSETTRAIKWTITAAAVTSVMATSGCSLLPGRTVANPIPDTPPTQAATAAPADDAPIALVAAPADLEPTVAPAINIFGEFDGLERGPARTASEANFQQHTQVTEGYDADVALDPAGKWMTFASTRHSVQPDIYLQRTDGMSVTQLTADPADDAFPAFSPDGKQIAFCSTRAGNWDIYVMDTDGRNAVQVTSSHMQEMHPSFSPDGKRLVYCAAGGRSDQWELWTADLETGEKRMIGYGLFPTWSPDKTTDRIAFQRARQRGSRWFSLWTLDLIDGEARRVTEVAVSSNAAIVSPSWSPDGQHLAFATVVEPAQTAAGKPVGQQDVWVIRADGSGRRRVTDGNGANLSPFWTVDNRIFFISDRGGAECVWSATVPAGSPAPREATAATDTAPAH